MRRTSSFAVITAAALLLALPGLAARAQAPVQGSTVELLADPEPPPPSSADPAPETAILSNELTVSRWAFVIRRVAARARPSKGAAVVKRLTTSTEDGTRELVLALSWRQLSNGSTWVRVRLPMRPNGTTGWVPRRALGRFHVVNTRLVINRKRFVVKLFRKGRRVLLARVGVGKRGTPTPKGPFYVRERLIPADKNSVYGVFAFGTSAFSPTLSDWPGGGIVGVHGTNQPELIPGRISHGCVRLRNKKITRLRRLMPLGTPIRIR